MTRLDERTTLIRQLLDGCTLAGSPIEYDREELEVLISGGVSVENFESATDAWYAANRVKDDWAYIRTVALHRRAEVLRAMRGTGT